jgi:hypothetical protein
MSLIPIFSGWSCRGARTSRICRQRNEPTAKDQGYQVAGLTKYCQFEIIGGTLLLNGLSECDLAMYRLTLSLRINRLPVDKM